MLSGRLPTYYLKQLLQEAVKLVPDIGNMDRFKRLCQRAVAGGLVPCQSSFDRFVILWLPFQATSPGCREQPAARSTEGPVSIQARATPCNSLSRRAASSQRQILVAVARPNHYIQAGFSRESQEKQHRDWAQVFPGSS